jgi:N-acyl-D-aspartate/D-glutamate deacylase
MADPALRAALLDGTVARRGRRPVDFSRVFQLGDPPNYEPPRETSVAAIAAARGVDPAELALDLMIEEEGRTFLFAPFSNYADFNLDSCREMLTHPDALLGLSDGGAHVAIICDASFPTYALSHWGRDRGRGRIGIGQLVEQLTGRAARAVGLLDRGEVDVGMRADLNVIDFDHLSCQRPVMTHDLPSGGKRLLQKAHGYAATIVNGEVIARDDKPTGALPGRLVRGPQADPRLNGA